MVQEVWSETVYEHSWNNLSKRPKAANPLHSFPSKSNSYTWRPFLADPCVGKGYLVQGKGAVGDTTPLPTLLKTLFAKGR